MPFRILLTTAAREDLQVLTANEKKLKKVRKTLALLEANPRHSGLNSHKYESIQGSNGEEIWESHVENNTPAAYRVFWFYGPDQGAITVIRITPHP